MLGSPGRSRATRYAPFPRWDGPAGVAESSFDALVTSDQNLEFQQSLAAFDLAILVLKGKTNRLADLRPLVPELLALLPTAPRGAATHVGP